MNLSRRDFASQKSCALCIAMIFMIVITGMCCRVGQADSLFCAVTGQGQTLIQTETLTDASEMCTQELLRRDNSDFISNGRMVRIRTNLRVVLFFVIAGVVLQFLKHILTTVCRDAYHLVCSNTVILSYIHHQDGKKR